MAGRSRRAEREDGRARKSPYPGVYPSGASSWQYKLRLPRDPATGQRPMETRGGFATDRDAHEARIRRQAQLIDGVARKPNRDTVGGYLRDWVERQVRIKPTTRYEKRRMIERLIVPHLGDIPLRQLEPRHVEDWLAALARHPNHRTKQPGLSAASIRSARGVLVTALNAAVAHRTIPYNPAAVVSAPAHTPSAPVVWTDAEIERVLPVIDADLELGALWRLALFTQLRPGELIALRWADVDLEAATLFVSATRTRDEEGRVTLGDSPKTPAGARPIPLPASTVLALRRHRARQNEIRLRHPLGAEWNSLGLVFPSPHGRLFNHQTLLNRLNKLCEWAGVRRLAPHGLRHTGATWLARRGVDPATISARLGHASVAFTLDVYVHPNDDDQRDAGERLEHPAG